MLAQAEASVSEDYERAAELGAAIEQMAHKEEACHGELTDGESKYEQAERLKLSLLQVGHFPLLTVTHRYLPSHAERLKLSLLQVGHLPLHRRCVAVASLLRHRYDAVTSPSQEEAQLWTSHMEECRRCLAARDEKARRQLASEESASDQMRSTLEAEELRLQTERQQHTARASEIGAKREETER